MQRTVFSDVDDTLILYDTKKHRRLQLKYIRDSVTGQKIKVRVHKKHVDLIKTMKLRGQVVVVWSAGGAVWAKDVVKALGLAKYVDFCLQKPDTIIDDLEPKFWLPQHPLFLKP